MSNTARLLERGTGVRRLSVALLGSAMSVWAGMASAQTGAQTQATQSASEASVSSQTPASQGDLVITALKRSTNLQKTPISVSAVTGRTLAEQGVTDIHNLLQVAPSLSFVDAGPSQTRVILRGIYSPGEPTVGLYYDETPVSGAVGSSSDAGASLPLVDLFDVERVEALRGPQGTLYGSGSMGGTLRVIFNRPVFTPEGSVNADVTATDRGDPGYDIQAMVNVPLIKDMLAVRGVLYDQHLGGYIDNTFLHQNNVNSSDTQGGRLMARFTPTDKLTIDGSILYQHAYGQDNKWTEGGGSYDSAAQTQLPFDDRLAIYNLTARWDLGPVVATAIVSDMNRRVTSFAQDASYFFNRDLNNPADCKVFAGGGLPCTPTEQASFNTYVKQYIPSAILDTQTIDMPSAEVRLSSNTPGFLDWTVGGFYSDRTTNAIVPILGANPVSGALNHNDVLYQRNVYDDLEQLAGFGETAAHLTSQLTLTFGARYFDYRRTTGGSLPVGLNLVGAKVAPFAEVTATESGWVTKTNLAYQFDPNFLGYVSASQGFRPGGVNQVTGLPSSLTAYAPDSLWDYEGGIKTSWFDKRLLFDIDAYLIDWTNMQVLGHGTGTAANFQFITNAGAAQVKGIEANLTAVPIDNLEIDANATFSNAELSQNQVSTYLLGAGVRGNRIPYIPEITAAVSAQYNWPITEKFGGMVRVDENYVGSSWSEFNNSAGFRRYLPAYSMTNARIGVEAPNKKWGVYLYVDNVFNTVAITYAFTQALSGGQTLVTSDSPMTIGLNVRTNF